MGCVTSDTNRSDQQQLDLQNIADSNNNQQHSSKRVQGSPLASALTAVPIAADFNITTAQQSTSEATATVSGAPKATTAMPPATSYTDKVEVWLSGVPLLSRLTDSERIQLGNKLSEQSFSAGTPIFHQGDQGHGFYIVISGQVQVVKDDVNIAVLQAGDHFGEQALINEVPRAATCRAFGVLASSSSSSNSSNEPVAAGVRLFYLPRDVFITMFGRDKLNIHFVKRAGVSSESQYNNSNNNSKLPSNRLSTPPTPTHNSSSNNNAVKSEETTSMLFGAMQHNVLFNNIDDKHKRKIIEQMNVMNVKCGADCIKQGDYGDNLYIVASGIFSVSVNGKVVATRMRGTIFGELALLYSTPRAATVTATATVQHNNSDNSSTVNNDDCVVYYIDRYSYRRIVTNMSEKKFLLFVFFLKKVELLGGLAEYERRKIAEALEEMPVYKNNKHTIFSQGDAADCLYIVYSGEVTITKKQIAASPSSSNSSSSNSSNNSNGDSVVAVCKVGDVFGERALHTNTTRAATAITTLPNTQLLRLNREAFVLLLGPLEHILNNRLTDYEQQDKRQQQQEQLKQQQAVTPSHISINNSNQNNSNDNNTNNNNYNNNNSSSNSNYSNNNNSSSNNNSNNNNNNNDNSNYSSNNNNNSGSNNGNNYQNNNNNYNNNNNNNKNYSNNNNSSNNINNNSNNNNNSHNNNYNNNNSNNNSNSSNNNNNNNNNSSSSNNNNSNNSAYSTFTSSSKQQLSFPETVKDFVVLATLGKGSFGFVSLVKDPTVLLSNNSNSNNSNNSSNRTLPPSVHPIYALKSLNKQQIVQTGQQQHVRSEKSSMLMLSSHPFIVSLHRTYNDSSRVHFLMEAALGGELFSLLRQRTLFHEEAAVFYAAQIVLVFDYVHNVGVSNSSNNINNNNNNNSNSGNNSPSPYPSNNNNSDGRNHRGSYVYRDLKPENLLLDTDGYLKLADFGFCKALAPGDRTWTLCGTPDYLAPEIVSGRGHDRAVDWWTLGVFIYEMLASYPPFYHSDPLQTYTNIMANNVKYPAHFSPSAISLISALLQTRVSRRLGMLVGGAEDVKRHGFFHRVHWDELLAKRVKAPFVPSVKSHSDASNFENWDAGERQGVVSYVEDGSGWDRDF